jgi:transcriptional regulator of acetoin/glycerol metabolism
MEPDSNTDASAIPRALASHMPTERELRELLAATRGNIAAVGRHFGKERMQVHRWMRRYNIDPNKYR